jgi:metallophosphoesterase (TIGR00282 family)
MKILFIGDIVGDRARKAVKKALGSIKSEYNIDFVIANGEHLSDRVGVDAKIVVDMHEAGIDFFTTGNHVWRQKDFAKVIDEQKLPIIRPANFYQGTPGDGHRVVETPFGKILIINLMGQHEINANTTSPFLKVDEILKDHASECRYVFVDFHAEMSSEKVSMGRYLDGRASVVVGTHTHLPSADARVLKDGTAVVSDVGFVGPMESVLGVKEEIVFETFISSMPQKFELADGPIQFNSVVIDLDTNGKARSIERVDRVIEV